MGVRKIFRSLAVLVFGVVAILVVVVNFSEIKTRLACNGEIVEGGQTRPGVFHVSLNEYRWWVSLWSDGSDGNMFVEMPDGTLLYYDAITGGEVTLGIYETSYKKGVKKSRKQKGLYSKLSQSLNLITPFGLFEGKCAVTH